MGREFGLAERDKWLWKLMSEVVSRWGVRSRPWMQFHYLMYTITYRVVEVRRLTASVREENDLGLQLYVVISFPFAVTSTMCLSQLSLSDVQVLKRTLSDNSYLNCLVQGRTKVGGQLVSQLSLLVRTRFRENFGDFNLSQQLFKTHFQVVCN